MKRDDLYIVESVSRALHEYVRRQRPRSRVAAEKFGHLHFTAQYLADQVSRHDGQDIKDAPLSAFVMQISRDLGLLGGAGVKRNPDPTVEVPSLKGLADATRFAEEAFPPDDGDLDL